MRNLIKGLGLCLVMLSMASTAFAGTVKEYVADLVDAKTGQTMAKYYVTENKIRVDMEGQNKGGKVATIIRMDQGKMYSLQEDKTYIEFPFKDKISNLEDIGTKMMGGVAPKRTEEKLGSETVNGYDTEKTRVTTNINMMGQKRTMVNTVWKAKEFDMPIRTQSDKGDITEMRNIKVGAPADSVFEVPAGYTKNAELEEMMKRMQGLRGAK